MIESLKLELNKSFNNINGIYTKPNYQGNNDAFELNKEFNLISELDTSNCIDFIKNNYPYLGDFIFNPSRRVGLKLLDIKATDIGINYGCNWGNLLVYTAKNCEMMVAVEQNIQKLKFVQRRLEQENVKNTLLINSKIQNELYLNDFFDFAIVNGTISQVRSKPLKVGQLKFLIRVQNSLKQGGKLFLAVKNNLSPQCFFRSLWPFHVDHNIYSYSGYRYLLKQAGFTNIKTYFVFPDYQFPSKILPSDKVLEFSYVPVYSRQYKRSLIKKAIIKIRTRLDLLIFKNFKLFQFSPSFIFVAESSR